MTNNHKPKTMLVIAGSDSGGGAGIQADIKTAAAHGVFATTAITALTAQNTQGVTGIQEATPSFVTEQIEVVLADIGADIIKIGMLANAPIIQAVLQALKKHKIPIVLDTVMIAKGGAPLLKTNAIELLKTKLMPTAYLVTPNIPEAENLTGLKIKDIDTMLKAGQKLIKMGAENVLVKGGHLDSLTLYDVLVTPKNFEVFSTKKIDTKNTHGTGCTLASAIACNLANGIGLNEAVQKATEYVAAAIKNAPNLGQGHGPLGHFAV